MLQGPQDRGKGVGSMQCREDDGTELIAYLTLSLSRQWSLSEEDTQNLVASQRALGRTLASRSRWGRRALELTAIRVTHS